jgi:pyridoxine 4-dehydrogenase
MSIGRAALKRVCNKPVGPVGYGMLSLSLPWSPVEQDAAVGLLKKALEQGSNLWNSVRQNSRILIGLLPM